MPELDHQTELQRLLSGEIVDPIPTGSYPFEIDATCAAVNAEEVLRRTREVLAVILRQGPDTQLPLEAWVRLLPPWIVEASAPELSAEEARELVEHRRQLTTDQMIAIQRTRRWPLSHFLYWFEPPMRQWWWWAAEVIDPKMLRILLVTEELTPAHDALDWLLRAAGATEVVDQNLREIMKRG